MSAVELAVKKVKELSRLRGYRIVTRDVGPFERMGCKVLNPWRR
jgi:hypothetical protein